MKKILLSLIIITAMAVSNTAMACDMCGKDSKTQQLHAAMQKLWADHMI